MTAIRFDPWAELAVLENAEHPGAAAKAARLAKVAPGVPAEWVDGVARLSTLPPSITIPRQGWLLAVKDARRFLRDWAGQGWALGWTTADIFGAHPTRPIQRIDCAGLILLLHGDEIVALTVEAGHIRTRTGAPMTFPRRRRPGAVPLWELG